MGQGEAKTTTLKGCTQPVKHRNARNSWLSERVFMTALNSDLTHLRGAPLNINKHGCLIVLINVA